MNLHGVLIELCRIEMDKGGFLVGVQEVLIELCRIEIRFEIVPQDVDGVF